MYLPHNFEEQRIDVLISDSRASARRAVTLDSQASMPITFPSRSSRAGAWGTLRDMCARHPVWRDFSQTVEGLVVFSSANLCDPSWYQTTSETGEVVPTFNYLAVHAYGR